MIRLMAHPIQITEVLTRSEQGATRPFLCRGENGRLYYVKGCYAGLRSLCCEWVAGRLARDFGLATPDQAMVEISGKLIRGSDRSDIRDLGEGLAFGSARVEGARELAWEEVPEVDAEVRARILLLDWWVRNEDRTLSSRGGNPNLLVTSARVPPDNALEALRNWFPKIWTFDFNLAFDPHFQESRFWENHVFAADRTLWTADFRDRMGAQMALLCAKLPYIMAELPAEWLHMEGDENLPVQLDPGEVRDVLRRPLHQSSQFWKES